MPGGGWGYSTAGFSETPIYFSAEEIAMRQYRPNQETAHQSVSVGATAQTLAQLGVVLSANTQGIVIQAESGDVRYTVSGTAPTTTLGFLCREFDQPLPLSRMEADALRLISPTGATVTLQITQYIELP
jgi:hypothetical protein